MGGGCDPCAPRAPRIGILMLNSPNIPRYAHLAAMINYAYAARHGYGFMVARCPDRRDAGKPWAWNPAQEYTLVWSKPRMLAAALRQWDVVMFVDSDAAVWDFDVKIEDRAAELFADSRACIVMAQDCGDASVCGKPDKLNAGVILARRTPEVHAVLEHWGDPDRDCAKWKYAFPYEQECANILRAKHYGDFIRKVDVEKLNGADGRWVRHFMATSAAVRTAEMRRRLREVLAPDLGRRAPGEGEPPLWPVLLAAVVVAVMVACDAA